MVALVGCGVAWGQAAGSLSGTVSDPTGAVIAGAGVTLTNTATGRVGEATTNEVGVYSFPQLAPGTYRLEVTKSGFKTAVREQVVVQVGLPTRQGVQLQVGAVAEVIEVTAGAAIVNFENATVGNPFAEFQVRQLPIEGRNPAQLLSLQAGVIWAGEEAQMVDGNADWRTGSVFGSRSNQGNVTLDGADVNDQYYQSAMQSVLPVPLDSVQEFRVTTNNPTADLGRSAGAQISLVTKQGSNDFHGSVYWFHRNDALASNGFFENQIAPPPGETKAAKAPLKRHIYGASGGGPIVKNRAFFFFNWEGRRDSTGTPQDRQVPTDSFRDGVLFYECQNPALCPGGTVSGLSGTHTVPAGFYGLTPAQLANVIDPCGTVGCVDALGTPITPGVNMAILDMFQSYPAGNLPSRGRDGGINFSNFFFTPGVTVEDNTYVARFDFNLDRTGKHTLSWRGTLASLDRVGAPAHFPGGEPSQGYIDTSKGFSASYVAQFTPTMVNTFRWGFTRQQTITPGRDGIIFHPGNGGFSTPYANTFSSGRRVPVHQFSNDLTVIRGKHTFQMGGLFRQPTNNRFAVGPNHIWTNRFRLDQLGGHCVQPGLAALDCPNLAALNALPTIASGAENLYREALGALMGVMSQFGTTQFLVDPSTLSPLPVGTPLTLEFRSNELEFYLQDSFRLRPDFTLNLGIRYSYFGPPWEVNGFQTGINVDLREWWEERQGFSAQGISSRLSPQILWSPSGKANNGSPLYEPDDNNFAPRVSLAYSPGFESGVGKFLFGGPGKSSIRAGYALTYVHMATTVMPGIQGEGLSQNLVNPVGSFDYYANGALSPAPRFTGLDSLPDPALVLTPGAVSFPFDPGTGSERKRFPSNRLLTPYSQHLTFTIQRELSPDYSFEIGYVGQLGRKLLAETEYNQYLNLRDPASGMTMYEALGLVDDFTGASVVAPQPCPLAPADCTIAPIPFVENVFPNLANFFGPGTATQNFAFRMQNFGAAPESFLISLDNTIVAPGVSLYNSTLDPQGLGRVLISPQFRGLTIWDNTAFSSYNGLIVTFRKRMSNGLQFDANYTWSKSLDNNSGLEQDAAWVMLPQSFDPHASWARSQFDIRHNFNANWIYELPFGQGKAMGTDMPGWADQIIGGWQLSGVWRWRSGFPIRFNNGLFFTNGFVTITYPQQIVPLESNVSKNTSCGASLFNPGLCGDQAAIYRYFRHTRAGEAGTRNEISGHRFFTIDLSIGKSFRMPWEGHRLQFRWEIFNLTNTVSFASDPTGWPWAADFGSHLNQTATFGQIFRTTSSASQTFPQVPHNRVIQIGLRYEF